MYGSSLISPGWFNGDLRISMAGLVSLKGKAVKSPTAILIQCVRHLCFLCDYKQRLFSFHAGVCLCDFPQVNGVVACHFCFTWSLNLYPLTCNTLEGFQGNRPALQPPPIQQMYQTSIGTVQTTIKYNLFLFPSSPSLHCNLCCLQEEMHKQQKMQCRLRNEATY